MHSPCLAFCDAHRLQASQIACVRLPAVYVACAPSFLKRYNYVLFGQGCFRSSVVCFVALCCQFMLLAQRVAQQHVHADYTYNAPATSLGKGRPTGLVTLHKLVLGAVLPASLDTALWKEV